MQKRTVFSPVRGQVLAGGKPVAHLEVVQRWSWLSVDDGMKKTTTDAEGRFAFPEVSARKLRAPKETFIVQDLEVVHEGRKVSLWNLTKTDTELNSELGGQAIELVAELKREAQEIKLPVREGTVATISGVSTFRHPYLERWAQLSTRVTEDGVAQALTRFLSSADGMKGLAAFFPAVGAQAPRVKAIDKVSEVKLTEGALYETDQGGHYALSAAPHFIGFTTHAQVAVKLDSGEAVTGRFFAWTLFLPLDESGQPKWEASFSDRWEVDARPWIRGRIDASLDRAKVAALVAARVAAAPGAELLETLDVRKGGLSVEGVELTEAKVAGSKDDWATVQVAGLLRLSIGTRRVVPRFVGHVSVELLSLASDAYRLAKGTDAPRFRVIPFKVVLETDKSKYALGEKIVLKFRVENLLDTPQRFLKWHTPFEGFANDYLDLEPTDGGPKVAYTGMLASRGPPGDSSYLTLAPGQSASSDIEITGAYPVTAKGEYQLRYKPLGDVWSEPIKFTVK